MHFVEVLHDAFNQVSHRHTNGPGGVALQLDNLIGPVVHTYTQEEKIHQSEKACPLV